MDHAEFPHIPRNIADDRLPQETDEQSHRERSAYEDGDKEEQGSVGGAPEDRRDEEARQDIEIGGEWALGMELRDAVREHDWRDEAHEGGRQVRYVLVEHERGLR